MADYRKSPIEFSAEELDKELIARVSRISDEKRLKFGDSIGTPERNVIIILKIQK